MTRINFNIILITIFCLALGAGLFYFYSHSVNTQDWRQYIPANSDLYGEINFNQTAWSALTNQQKEFFRKNNLVDEFSDQLLGSISQLALIKIPLPKEMATVWLLKTKKSQLIVPLLPANKEQALLNANVVAISNNQQALDQVKNTMNTKFDQPRVEIDQKFSQNNFLNIYWPANSISQKKILASAAKLLGQPEINWPTDIFLGVKKNATNWSYELITKNSINIAGQNFSENIKKINQSDNKIFQQLLLSNSQLKIMLANLKDVWENNKILTTAIKPALIKKYSILEKIPLNLFAGETLLITENKVGKIANNTAPWGLIIKTNLNSEMLNESMVLLKNLITDMLGQLYPQEKTKKLPDGTTMTELVIDKNNFKFKETKELPYSNVKYEDGAWFVGANNDYFIITNNEPMMTEILTIASADLITNETEKILTPACDFLVGQEFMLIDINKTFAPNWPWLMAAVNVTADKSALKLTGCAQ